MATRLAPTTRPPRSRLPRPRSGSLTAPCLTRNPAAALHAPELSHALLRPSGVPKVSSCQRLQLLPAGNSRALMTPVPHAHM